MQCQRGENKRERESDDRKLWNKNKFCFLFANDNDDYKVIFISNKKNMIVPCQQKQQLCEILLCFNIHDPEVTSPSVTCLVVQEKTKEPRHDPILYTMYVLFKLVHLPFLFQNHLSVSVLAKINYFPCTHTSPGSIQCHDRSETRSQYLGRAKSISLWICQANIENALRART